MKGLLRLTPLAAVPLLAGCNLVVMNPAGDVARQQANLVLWSTGLMLLIIVPVMVLTVVFAWRYRAGNKEAEYRPNWDHSTGLELVIWSAPLLIIIALGALTWVSTHLLDPYRPLNRIAAGRPVPAGEAPLEVQVVSLDWKWLFIYPEQGIATVNRLVLPTDRQVRFRLTSTSVMNTFYVPAMAGMIYTMPGMETKLHAVLNEPGRFDGMSANYSGAGFSYMNFKTYSVDGDRFDQWVGQVRRSPMQLTRDTYLRLEKPSEKVPPMQFAAVQPGLFTRIVNMCVAPGTTCMAETMRHDMQQDGSHAPVNAGPGGQRKTEGALQKGADEIEGSPHLMAPRGTPEGKGDPGDESNRNMTMRDLPTLPGAQVRAHS